MPEGKLIITHNGKYLKWFNDINHKQIYIPKKEKEFAMQLAKKKFLQYESQDLTREIVAIDSYLKKSDSSGGKAINYLISHPEYQELLPQYSLTDANEQIVSTNTAPHPEGLIYRSISGNTLRSKSELLIDMALFQSGLTYSYEKEIVISGISFFPDFSITHPVSNEFIYWEHFGLFSNQKYVNKSQHKIQQYLNHNILPFKNLIITYESEDYALDLDEINKLIKHFFF